MIVSIKKGETYERPELEVIEIKVESIVCTSPGEGGTGDPFTGEEG